MSRRDALQILSGLFAVPLLRWPTLPADPLAGTILEYQAGRVRGDWTATEVVRAALERCRALDGRLHLVDLLADDTAMKEAAASDERARRRALRGPLDGVPLFAKSIYDMAGLPTTGSSAVWAELFPEAVGQDAIEVARLRAAGGVILGKTAADDFAYRGNGTSSLTGQVWNPYDPTLTKTPGGSSAGSAVAAACGITFAGLGTDDGGSNRIPAQFSGVVGVKPTFGLVPRTGVLPTWPYLDTHGPMARTVADAALMLDALAGPDASDGLARTGAWRYGSLAALKDDSLTGIRVGVPASHFPRERMSAESVAVIDRAIADLRAAGAIVEPFEPGTAPGTYRQQFMDAASARGDVRPDPRSPGPTANALLRYFEHHGGDARASVRKGLAIFRSFYDVLPESWDAMAVLIEQPYEQDPAGVSFARSREAVIAIMTERYREQRIDAILHPTMPFPAPLAVDRWPGTPTTLSYGNWLGTPEVSVPGGYGSDGMPAGNVSFSGLPGSDIRLLEIAHAFERVSQRFVPPP